MAAALTLALAACGGLHSSVAEPQTYLLRVERPAADAPTEPLAASLQVARPLARPGLDTARIALIQPDQRLDYYALARWPTEAPQLLEGLIVDSLRETGSWTAVHDSRSFFPADFLLQITVRHFEAQYASEGAAPTVHIALDCLFGRRMDRELLTTFVAESTVPVDTNRMGAVVAAYERAVREATQQIAERVLTVARENPVNTSPGPTPP